jgi:hypothetical protein
VSVVALLVNIVKANVILKCCLKNFLKTNNDTTNNTRGNFFKTNDAKTKVNKTKEFTTNVV